jgi:hypothetical protein
MLRIAIVGLGRAGMRHVEAIQELCRKITVDCLVDNDPDHLREKATKLDIEKMYTDFHHALATPMWMSYRSVPLTIYTVRLLWKPRLTRNTPSAKSR